MPPTPTNTQVPASPTPTNTQVPPTPTNTQVPASPTPTPHHDDGPLVPEADAYVRNGKYAGDNYGGEAFLIAKDGGDEVFDRRIFIRFNLKDVQGLASKAELTLTVDKLPNGEPAPIKLFKAANNWSEHEITYNTQPESGSAPIGEVVITNQGKITFDITDYVNEKLNSGDTMLTVMLTDDSLARRLIRFYSRESATPPTLTLTFAPSAS